MDKINKIYDLIETANREMYQVWIQEIIFSWRWWVALILSIIPWIIWVRYRKKDSTYRLLLSGAVVTIITSYLDFVGSSYKLWYYDSKVLPLLPSFIPWDFTLFPVSIMFLLQIKPNANRFIKAFIFSTSCSFIFEKLFKLIGFYVEVHWNSIYSFPMYFVIYLIADYFCRRDAFCKLV